MNFELYIVLFWTNLHFFFFFLGGGGGGGGGNFDED